MFPLHVFQLQLTDLIYFS